VRRDLLPGPLSDPGVLARLDAMLAELRALRKLYLTNIGVDADDGNLTELLHAIRDWTRGNYSFSVSELITHARLPAATNLRAAIIAAIGGLDAGAGKRLGQLLRRNACRNINGLQIRREGHDGAGAIWAITSYAQ
jgi:hypothetical protein